MRTKQNKLKVVYKFLEPASEAERKEQERRLERAYDILFKEAIKEWPKKYGKLPRWLDRIGE